MMFTASPLSRPSIQLIAPPSFFTGFNWMDPPAFQAMYQAFNPSKNGLLGLTEFLAVAAFLKTVLGTFKGFDQAGRGSIVLNLNQFLYAASNTR